MSESTFPVGHFLAGWLRHDRIDADQRRLPIGQVSRSAGETLRSDYGQARRTCETGVFLLGESLTVMLYSVLEQGEVCHEMVLDFPYLDQVIHEILRLYSPVVRFSLWLLLLA